MTTATPRLNDLQRVLLASAAGREDGSLIPLPETCRDNTGRVTRAIASLLRRGLIEERAVTARDLAWREQDQTLVGVFITSAGRAAIGLGDNAGAGEPRSDPETPVMPNSPRAESKIASVLALLRRKGGATLAEITTQTGWLPHTARAALTGLRKKGYAIARGKREGVTCYALGGEA